MRFLSLALLICLLSGFCVRAQPLAPPVSSAAVESSHVFCQAECSLWSASITTAASAGLWMVFDAAAAPADGAVAPKYCWEVPATSSRDFAPPTGARFQVGLVFVFSTGSSCVTKAASATAFFSGVVTP
jgi:hypothetical protein